MKKFKEEKSQQHSQLKITAVMTIMVFVYYLTMINLYYSVIRFELPFFNHIFFWLVQLFPIIILILSLKLRERFIKIIVSISLAPILLSSFLFGFASIVDFYCLVFESKNMGKFLNINREKVVEGNKFNISVYYEDHYRYLRQEKVIFPEVVLVKNIYSSGPGVDIVFLGDNTIKITENDFSSKTTVIFLKNWVYI